MMKRFLPVLFFLAISVNAWADTELSIAAQSGEFKPIVLKGKTSGQQLVVTAKQGVKLADVTHKVVYVQTS